jgi:hypothetical protein
MTKTYHALNMIEQIELKDKYDELLTLVDGACDIIELWKAETPFQQVWKDQWMKKARGLGAISLPF